LTGTTIGKLVDARGIDLVLVEIAKKIQLPKSMILRRSTFVIRLK
jgi:hypothetical protein